MSPEKQRLMRFAVVGATGFVIDAGLTFAFHRAGLSPWLARLPAYLVANLGTYTLNRNWTFNHRDRGFLTGWARYFASTAAGAAVNYAAYSVVLLLTRHSSIEVLGAVAAGSLAGMSVNYLAARHFVFR